MCQPEQTGPDASQERSRLIDHFKRAYQIIVGLAITQGCVKLFPDEVVRFPSESFWLFGIFFITIVPIFHGGDRSLDLKYLGRRPQGFWQQFAYIWDVYMLLITAILFVKIALAIPGPELLAGTAAGTRAHFYEWMGGMLLFDVAVLIVDWIKSTLLKSEARAQLRVYFGWIVLNAALAVICLCTASASDSSLDSVVFAAAIARTVLDYIIGKNFMFP